MEVHSSISPDYQRYQSTVKRKTDSPLNVDGKIACNMIRIGHNMTYFHQPNGFILKGWPILDTVK